MTTRAAAWVVAALLAGGCDDEDVTQDLAVVRDLGVSVGPDLTPPGTLTFTTTLTGAEEVPPVTTPHSGTSTATLDAARTTIVLETTHTIPPGDTTAAHIHVGAVGVAGPIIFNIVMSGTVPPTTTRTFTAADLVPRPELGVNTFADAVDRLIAGETYVNVHTVANPTGEIRGQLQ